MASEGLAILDEGCAGYPRNVLIRDREAAYVKQWAATGRLLEEQRWAELAHLDDAQALAASDALIASALAVPVPRARQSWSGLVEQQDAFHRRRA
jgi:hypothetical protein